MNTVTETYREMIRVRIRAIVSTDIIDDFEIQAIQERIRQISSSPTEESILQGTIFIKDHILSDITEKL